MSWGGMGWDGVGWGEGMEWGWGRVGCATCCKAWLSKISGKAWRALGKRPRAAGLERPQDGMQSSNGPEQCNLTLYELLCIDEREPC